MFEPLFTHADEQQQDGVRCVNEHCDEREVRKSLIMLTTCSSLGSPQVTVKSFNPTELKHSRRRWPITASCVNTVVDAWRSRARDRPPHHINIQLCLQEMIDSQQQQQNTVKTNSSVNLSAEIFTQYHPAVTNTHWSLFHPCSGGKSKV